MQLSRGRESQAEEAARAKALRWKHTAEFEGLLETVVDLAEGAEEKLGQLS